MMNLKTLKLFVGGALALLASQPWSQAQFTNRFYNFGAPVDTGQAVAQINAGTPVVTVTAPVINYSNGSAVGSIPSDVAFPGSPLQTDNFGLLATATIGSLSGSSFYLGVNSDDGFSLRINGTEVLQVPNPRSPADSITSVPVALQSGDLIQLYYFQNNLGAEVELFTTNNAAGSGPHYLVGTSQSGVLVPEPSATVAVIGGLGLLAGWQRRRRAAR